MTQKRVRRRSPSTSTHASTAPDRAEHKPSGERRSATKPSRERRNQGWDESSDPDLSISLNSLPSLIEQDAPLKTNTALVLMYGPFQAEMAPESGQGVASWLQECVRKHGIPSLVRFDYRHRAQVFRRDQFQLWLEPLINQLPR